MAIINVDQANTLHGIQSCPAQYDANFDYTQCVNDCASAAGAGGTVRFTRGNEYKLTGPVYTSGGYPDVSDNVTFEDIGSGALSILHAQSPTPGAILSIPGGLLLIRGNGVTVRNLHLRGPWPDTIDVKHRVWHKGHYGVHLSEKEGDPNIPASMVWFDNFTLQSTTINGFGANGLQLTGGSGHQILNNTIVYNYETGVAVFGATDDLISATAINVNGNTLSYNGANGLDTCADFSEYRDNHVEDNGWAHTNFDAPGEGQGFIFNPCKREMKDLVIDGNTILRSARSGMVFLDDGVGLFNGIGIRNNHLHENGRAGATGHGWGVEFQIPMQNTILEFNDAMLNVSGCYTIPYSGVTVGDNCCEGQGGPGPGGMPCLQ